MRILIYSHSYFAEENQKNIEALAKYCRVRCVLPKSMKLPFNYGGKFEASGTASSLFEPVNVLRLFGSQYVLLTVAKAAQGFRPDVINVEYNPWSTMFLQAMAYRALFAPDSKIVCTIKKNTFAQPCGIRGMVKRAIAMETLQFADHIIAASNCVEKLLTETFKVGSRQISVCPHLGVDTSVFKPVAASGGNAEKADCIAIGYAGRLVASKGVEDLIEAVKRVIARTGAPIQLRLLGQQLPRGWLEPYRAYSWLRILPAVSIPEVATFLRTLDLFVLPSRILPDHQEHDAHALLEALSTGLPCVGTRSGIIPEIIGDGTGCLVEPHAPQELSEVLETLVRNPWLRQDMAFRARRKAIQEYSLDVVARKKVSILRKVINAKCEETQSGV